MRRCGQVGFPSTSAIIPGMENAPKQRMTVDEFLVWAEAQPGRYELHGGEVFSMAAERTVHAKIKFAVQTSLVNGIRKAGLPCHMLPDGMTVRITNDTAHEPDALVYCGEELPPDAIEVPNPVIVVEVLSPSTRRIDASKKLGGYFSLPSLHHYLIVDPEKPPLIHHQRQADGTILTRLISDGAVRLDPPGFSIQMTDIFG
jgi:Uma2 family endonuclease